MLIGLGASFAHNQNGMTLSDMEASKRVADQLDEVIIFRSTGPWSKRWLEKGYPSKNFHVKGKSSDWGPHAGLVPYDGTYSKVGYDAVKGAKGTKANDDGLASGFAGREPLMLSSGQITEQLNRHEGSPARTAIVNKIDIAGSRDLLLIASRSGDQRRIMFRAFNIGPHNFEIKVYPPSGIGLLNPFLLLDRDPSGQRAIPFEVMTSNEIGAGKPMTGDYDLFSICCSWGAYGNRAPGTIAKAGIRLANGTTHEGIAFAPGHGMDKVLDPRLHTMSKGGDHGLRRDALREKMRNGGLPGGLSPAQSQAYFGAAPSEHADMGNLTPRILRCINQLNIAMGAVGEKSALRRVHHNAESHRHRTFGALSARDMTTRKDGDMYGDGFPLTVFQPASLYRGNTQVALYGDVSTLETLAEFQRYALELAEAGYYVPKNWIWSGAGA